MKCNVRCLWARCARSTSARSMRTCRCARTSTPTARSCFEREQGDLLQDLYEIPQRSCDRKARSRSRQHVKPCRWSHLPSVKADPLHDLSDILQRLCCRNVPWGFERCYPGTNQGARIRSAA